MCPQCGYDNGIELHCRELTKCSQCHKQTSVMSGTLFNGFIYRYLNGLGIVFYLLRQRQYFSVKAKQAFGSERGDCSAYVNENQSGYGTQG